MTAIAKHIIAYRVQADDGRGPWRPGWSHEWIDGDADAGHLTETLMDLMPAEALRALPPTMVYGCGCRSYDALMAWFTPRERQRLKGFGYYPVRLNVDAILRESEKQILVARLRPFSIGATRLRWPDA